MTDQTDKFRSVLLDVWREACRHTEIPELATNVLPMLQDYLPVERLIVRRVEPEAEVIDTVAESAQDGAATCISSRTGCSRSDIAEIKQWCREGRPCNGRDEDSSGVALKKLAPFPADAGLLIGPLHKSDSSFGALILIPGNEQLADDHLNLFRALLEPFSVALDNSTQIEEISRLRAAAEADRRSLLTRLGRKRIQDTIVGADSGLREVMSRAAQVAGSDVPVLIFGETGAGKELLARTIHNHSDRAEAAFLRVNCGAIPPELVDSELFGHERGSFTGATSTRKGWFERADGGTLLLDEVAELPRAAQVRLLRVLQDGILERVGGQKPIHVDVRIIAATHRDLPAMVGEEKFREDLWYRIAVFPIVLPPLRNRKEDIPGLARHFAERAATRFGLMEVKPSEEDLRLLRAYDWPGNVRELSSVMDRAAILGDGASLEVEKALGISDRLSSRSSFTPQPEPRQESKGEKVQPLEEVVKSHIELALQSSNGRIEGKGAAADLLNVHPSTLRARIRKLGIDIRRFRTEKK